MSEKIEKHEKGLLARTATYTSKKARRTTTKLKQRVGKGDETKDEVFDEFVANFNRQQTAAQRLTTELRNYLRCITAMQVAASTFGEAVKDVYEDDWSGRDSLKQFFSEADSNWTCLSTRLTDEVLEPLTSYQKPFVEVKNKIHKRSRKLVDYDHSRHAVDTLRAKGATKSSDAKKLNQAEEEYQKAKDIFIDLTSELYEELPALYDSRIGFYVSCFQSVFTLEEVFHREASNIKHSLNDLLDQLIKDFSAGTYSTRKPFSAGLETTSTGSEKEDNDSKLSSGSLTQFYDVAVPSAPETIVNENRPDSTNDTSLDAVDSPVSDRDSWREKLETDISSSKELNNTKDCVPLQPGRPAPRPPPPKMQEGSTPPHSTPAPPSRPSQPFVKVASHDKADHGLKQISVELKPSDAAEINTHSPSSTAGVSEDDAPIYDKIPSTSKNQLPERSTSKCSPSEQKFDQQTEVGLSGTVADNVVAYKNNTSPNNPNKCNLIVPTSIFKAVATHNYSPEDEDELSFEKGEIIHVIPYEDPEEQDDGWLMGVMDSNGLVGVFPENFTKPLDASCEQNP